MTRRSAGRSAPPGGRGGGGPIRTIRARKPSSRRWLQRQLNDPYVAEAQRLGYRSRAAFKLTELDDQFGILAPGKHVVDLGAAPGGWTQIAVDRVKASSRGGGRVIAVDVAPMDPVPGADTIAGDLRDDAVRADLRERVGGKADVVLSDMAPSATGHSGTDHLRIMALAEAAFATATELLAPGGAFVCKVFQGGTEASLLAEIKRHFAAVRHAKPRASRPESAEVYLVAKGFRGPAPMVSG